MGDLRKLQTIKNHRFRKKRSCTHCKKTSTDRNDLGKKNECWLRKRTRNRKTIGTHTMDEILNCPKSDPQGEPIPDKDGNMISQDLQKLSDCKVGNKVVFTSVTSSDDDFLNFLNAKNLELGKKIEVLDIEKFDKSMMVKNGKNQLILSKMVCEKILVKP
mgnify:CR=1 FL=1